MRDNSIPNATAWRTAGRQAGLWEHAFARSFAWSVAAVVVMVFVVALPASHAYAQASVSRSERQEMVERGLQFLFSQAQDGQVGDSRRMTVTSLYVLACLSSGIGPDHPEHGQSVQAALDWVLANSSDAFLGGAEEPNADHAMASLMLMEMVGRLPSPDANFALYQRASAALEYGLSIQEKGMGADYYGGWKRDDQTRVNDRFLTAWYLHLIYSAELRGFEPSKSSLSRAVGFVSASQKPRDHAKADERGGFSVDVQGLAVRSTTASGFAALTLYAMDEPRALEDARGWLHSHPPIWRGPNYYESNFFATRGLYRIRSWDQGQAFGDYFGRVARQLKDQQLADGSFPFPPGHARPLLEMGPAYSTAMAVLILNVDRGELPLDR